jgi:outer membrane protein TolC
MMAAGRRTRAASLAAALCLVAVARDAGAGEATLTLAEALERASDANEDVAILAEHVTQAKTVRLQVLSGLLPWLTASANLGFTDEVVMETGGGESRVIVPGTDWGWGGSLSLKLVDLGLIPTAIAASKGVKAQKALLEHGTSEILFATAQAFVTALFARTAVSVREREVETRQGRLEEVEARKQADQALELDLKRAELQVLEARQALEASRVDAVLALDALCLLMGEEPGTSYVLAPLDAGVVPAPEQVPQEAEMLDELEEALEHRADLEALALELSAAGATRTASWLDLLPTLSFSASYDQGPESFRSPEGYTWYVSFNMSWTIFDGAYTAAKIKESHSKASEALLELGKSEKSIKSEVRSAWLKFNLGITNRDTAFKQLEVASKAYEMAEERYRAGLATGLEVDDALDGLAEAEIGLLGQEMNLQLAWLDYLRSSGQFDTFFEVE